MHFEPFFSAFDNQYFASIRTTSRPPAQVQTKPKLALASGEFTRSLRELECTLATQNTALSELHLFAANTEGHLQLGDEIHAELEELAQQLVDLSAPSQRPMHFGLQF